MQLISLPIQTQLQNTVNLYVVTKAVSSDLLEDGMNISSYKILKQTPFPGPRFLSYCQLY